MIYKTFILQFPNDQQEKANRIESKINAFIAATLSEEGLKCQS